MVAIKKFVGRLAKQGEDYIIAIPRELRPEVKSLHRKYLKVTIEEIEK